MLLRWKNLKVTLIIKTNDMQAKEFIDKAQKQLSSIPLSRLSESNRKIVDRDNYIADIHCHLFDVKTINIRYFLLRAIKDKLGLRDDQLLVDAQDSNIKYLNNSYETLYESDLLGKKVDTDEEWSKLLEEIEYIEEKNIPITGEDNLGQRGIVDVLKNRKLLRCKNMEEVYDYYVKKFSLTQYSEFGLDDKEQLVTALMMDLESGWEITVRKNMRQQIEELKALSQKKPVLPFFPIDPRREGITGDFNLYRLFLEAFTPIDNSFFGVKVYPGLGFLPSDYRLLPIFEICQDKCIPILTHCGGESVTTDHGEIDAFRLDVPVQIKGKRRQDVAEQLNHPKEWIPVLEKFPNLKLNFGHFGGDTAWEDYDKFGKNEKVKTIMDLMSKYNHVYADFSWNLIDSSLFSIYKTVLELSPTTLERSLYGSDYWVVCPAGDLKKRQKEFLGMLHENIDKLTYKNVKRYLFQDNG